LSRGVASSAGTNAEAGVPSAASVAIRDKAPGRRIGESRGFESQQKILSSAAGSSFEKLRIRRHDLHRVIAGLQAGRTVY
jgi:hypothetical protein